MGKGRGWVRRGGICAAAAAVVLASGCGGDADARWSADPAGPERLPDFAPAPPEDIHTKQVGESWSVEFSSALVNVGPGDFHATAEKNLGGEWTVTQDVEHADGGASHVAREARPVWGGDGHEHWHVERYVTYYLLALDEQGEEEGTARTDHKVGFCIYDFEHSHDESCRRLRSGTRTGVGKCGPDHLPSNRCPGASQLVQGGNAPPDDQAPSRSRRASSWEETA